MPKHLDPIWNHFTSAKKENNCGKWAVCKKCRKEMQGIPARLRLHVKKCLKDSNADSDNDNEGESTSSAALSFSSDSSQVSSKTAFPLSEYFCYFNNK